MALHTLSPLIAWSLLAQQAFTLQVGRPSTGHSDDPEWADRTILGRANWTLRIKECESEKTSASAKVLLADPQPGTRPGTEKVAPNGSLTEFSDLSPAEMAWVEDEYIVRCAPSCSFSAPNISVDGPRGNVSLVHAPDFPFTTGECKAAYGGLAPNQPSLNTCRFKDLYTVGGALIAHVLETDAFPSGETLLLLHAGAWPKTLRWVMNIQKHKSKIAFQAYMAERGQGAYNHIEGTTLAFIPRWHFNIGHALYDGLYPAFVALLQWGMDQAPFRVFRLGGANPGTIEAKVPGAFGRNEGVMGQIAGRGFIAQAALKRDAGSIFETLVLGMGRNAQKLDMNANFSLGGGRELGATRLFRSHAFRSLGIEENPKRSGIGGIIISNRRWVSVGWVDEVRSRAAAANVNLEYIQWDKAPDTNRFRGGTKHNPSPTSGMFRDQLLLVSRTDIHISSPGTAMMYQHFLPDGAVHINLGEDHGFPRLFMEEYMAEGAPYIRALYYWPIYRSLTGGYDAGRVMDYVLQAKELIQKGFATPVPVNANLSPAMRVVKAFMYLTQDEGPLRDHAPLWLSGPEVANASTAPSYATDYFGNHFPHEYLARSSSTPVTRGKRRYLNQCLLGALTEDYGPPCEKCWWGFPQ